MGFFLFTLLLYSCSESVSYSTNTSDKIAFSEDTVRFDTLISTIGSATKTMSVYNRNKEALRITHVRLGQGLSSPFRVNVDGNISMEVLEKILRFARMTPLLFVSRLRPPK